MHVLDGDPGADWLYLTSFTTAGILVIVVDVTCCVCATGCMASTEDSLLALVKSGSGLPSLDRLSGV